MTRRILLINVLSNTLHGVLTIYLLCFNIHTSLPAWYISLVNIVKVRIFLYRVFLVYYCTRRILHWKWGVYIHKLFVLCYEQASWVSSTNYEWIWTPGTPRFPCCFLFYYMRLSYFLIAAKNWELLCSSTANCRTRYRVII